MNFPLKPREREAPLLLLFAGALSLRNWGEIPLSNWNQREKYPGDGLPQTHQVILGWSISPLVSILLELYNDYVIIGSENTGCP